MTNSQKSLEIRIDDLLSTASELRAIQAKCRKIKEIDGEPVKIAKIALARKPPYGIILIYKQGEGERRREYTNEAFYKI